MTTAPALVLRLAAPMQSWGVRGGFTDYRDTVNYPTRSGVLGFLACALGRPRGDPPGALAGLDLTVRIDRPGTPSEDYQTIGGQSPGEVVPSANGKLRQGAVLTRRAYLADAAFTVILTGPAALLREICAALDHPAFPLYLGRRGNPPAAPYNLGLHHHSVGAILKTAPLDRAVPAQQGHVSTEVITTVRPGDPRATHTLNDDPHGERHFSERTVARHTIALPAELCTGRHGPTRYAKLHAYRYGQPGQELTGRTP